MTVPSIKGNGTRHVDNGLNRECKSLDCKETMTYIRVRRLLNPKNASKHCNLTVDLD